MVESLRWHQSETRHFSQKHYKKTLEGMLCFNVCESVPTTAAPTLRGRGATIKRRFSWLITPIPGGPLRFHLQILYWSRSESVKLWHDLSWRWPLSICGSQHYKGSLMVLQVPSLPRSVPWLMVGRPAQLEMLCALIILVNTCTAFITEVRAP